MFAGDPRTPDEVRDAVYLFTGDAEAKTGRFWLLLIISAVIATAGVIGDSSATVIGAMIVAPLAIPIQAIAVAIAYGEAGPLLKSLMILLCAVLAVIGVGALLGYLLPSVVPLSDNSQIISRSAPTLVDLAAAAATGCAGAFATARRDLADILPGVAIAISLVPPLAVVGVTAGHGHWADAAGALLLFGTNLVAMIVVGIVVHSALGHARERRRGADFHTGRVYTVVAVSTIVVTAALAIGTVRAVEVSDWVSRTRTVASHWAAEHGETEVSTDYVGNTMVVGVEGTSNGSQDSELLSLLKGQVPAGTPMELNRVSGVKLHVGLVP